jgi:deoxyribonuclease-4
VTIYLGTAGIPLGVKGEPTASAFQFLSGLGLNAMEVEFVQGVRMGSTLAERVGIEAKKYGIRLSVHAPYFINLCSTEKDKLEASKRRILDSADRAERMGADTIAIHMAYYGSASPEQCFCAVKQQLSEVRDSMRDMGISKVRLGAETMAKKTQFGSLDEVIRLSREIDVVVPYVDWAHLFARNGGTIDYQSALDELLDLKLNHLNCHFEGLKKRGGEYVDVHDTVGVNAPPFEPLAEQLIKRGVHATLICESPYLEHDALKMKSSLEKLGYVFQS